MEQILETLDEGVIVTDPKGNITFFNDPVSNMSGLSSQDVIGKNILEVFEDLTEETSTFYQVLSTKEAMLDHIQTFKNYNGHSVTTLTSTFPIVEAGEVIGVVEVFRKVDYAKKLKHKILELERELALKQHHEMNKMNNGTNYTFADIVTSNTEMLEIIEKALKIVDSDSPVLVYGETGTGKELLVQGIHNASEYRKSNPFVAQNCAAIPKELLEGILFGTSAGSFTGAKDKPGLFELASGGTLFLDEINSMDLDLQSKLLRVLQNKKIRPLGSKKEIAVDVRVMAATNIPPLDAVEKHQLRADLYYRLNVISFGLPSLRERKEDIPLLIEHFLNDYNKRLTKNIRGLEAKCLEILKAYEWPGNVRQLQYMMESMMTFTNDIIIGYNDLPKSLVSQEQMIEIVPNHHDGPLRPALEKLEREMILHALTSADGNCSEAARKLNIPKQTLHNKMKKLNITIGCTITS